MYHFRVLNDSDVIFQIIYYLNFFCRPAFKIKTKRWFFGHDCFPPSRKRGGKTLTQLGQLFKTSKPTGLESFVYRA